MIKRIWQWLTGATLSPDEVIRQTILFVDLI